MKILFVYTCLPLGGIETWLVRLSKELKNQNIESSFLFFSHKFNDNLLNELKLNAEVYHWDDFSYAPKFLNNKSPLLKLLFPLKNNKTKKYILNDITHIHAPDTNSLLFTQKLTINHPHIPVSTGIYTGAEFSYINYKKFYFAKYLLNLIHFLPSENMFIFGETGKFEFQKNYGNKFQSNPIISIGVDVKQYQNEIIGQQNLKLVSVGRLVAWKKYFYHVIIAIKYFNTKNIHLTFHSYGDGPERETLTKLVANENLSHQIFFHGSIEYANFKNVVSNALCFIGSGTSIIEAAACGMPCIIGIDNEVENNTYGFFHEIEGVSYQEKGLGLPTNNYEFFIAKLIQMSEDEFTDVCKKSQVKANQFSIENATKIHVAHFKNSKPGFLKFNFFKYICFLSSMLYHYFYSKYIVKSNKNYFNRL